MKGVYGNSKKDYTAFRNCVSDLANGRQLKSNQILDFGSVFTDKLSENALMEIAETHGLIAKIISGEWANLCHRDYPSIVKYNDGCLLLVIRASEDSVLLYNQSEAKTSIVSKDLFLSRWSGYAVTFQYNS